MRRNRDSIGVLEGDEAFMAAMNFVKCDSQWEENVYRTFEEYQRLIKQLTSGTRQIHVLRGANEFFIAYFSGAKPMTPQQG